MQDHITKFLTSQEVKALSETTQRNYHYALHHLNIFAKERGIIDPATAVQHAQAFVDYLVRKRLSGASIQLYLTTFKLFCRWSGQEIRITYRIPNGEKKANQRKQLRRWFDEDDIAKCLAYPFEFCDTDTGLRYRIVIRLLCETGARIKEVALIRAEDVELEDRIVWLMTSKTEPRPSFISEYTRTMFEALQASMENWEGALFPDVRTIMQTIYRMLTRLGLKGKKDGRGPHTFRHYVATQLFYEGGMRIEDIAFLLGDKTQTIVQHYLHPSTGMMKKRVESATNWNHDTNNVVALYTG